MNRPGRHAGVDAVGHRRRTASRLRRRSASTTASISASSCEAAVTQHTPAPSVLVVVGNQPGPGDRFAAGVSTLAHRVDRGRARGRPSPTPKCGREARGVSSSLAPLSQSAGSPSRRRAAAAGPWALPRRRRARTEGRRAFHEVLVQIEECSLCAAPSPSPLWAWSARIHLDDNGVALATARAHARAAHGCRPSGADPRHARPRALRRRGGGIGCAAICSGGGQGDAVIVEVNAG